ncbi:MAG: exopolysaccharide biosynthesis protein, partial [Candidatus Binatia bacterium]
MTTTYADLISALEACTKEAREEALTLGEAFDRLGESSYSLIAIVLCLPFLQPISLGPLSTVGGLTFAVLGWQLARQRPTPWLPERVRQSAPNAKIWEKIITLLRGVVRFCARFTKPRYGHLVNGPRGDQIVGGLMAVGGLLMAIPFFGIPFNNTLPALVIIAAAIAELEDDGAFIFVAFGLLAVTLAYFAFIFWAVFFV